MQLKLQKLKPGPIGLGLFFFVFQAGNEQNATAALNISGPIPPYIAGRWKVDVRHVEMMGNEGFDSNQPCTLKSPDVHCGLYSLMMLGNNRCV